MCQKPLKKIVARNHTSHEKVINFFWFTMLIWLKNRSPKFHRKKITGSAKNAKNAFSRRRGRRSKKSTFSKLAEILQKDREYKTVLDLLVPFFSKMIISEVIKALS